jgi:hypothetical protein
MNKVRGMNIQPCALNYQQTQICSTNSLRAVAISESRTRGRQWMLPVWIILNTNIEGCIRTGGVTVIVVCWW